MKKILLILFILPGITAAFAQDDYKTQYLGWIKKIQPEDPVKPVQYDNRSFSAKQLSICNLLIHWIQSSYTPKGGLGEGRKIANDKLGPYNDYTRSLHQYYGGFLPTYVFLKKKTGGGWTPENNLGLFLRVIANGLAGDHVDVISSPEQYYFYIPGVEENDDYSRQKQQYQGFDSHPVLNRFIHYYQPASIRYLAQYVVVLSKNNELPWVQITKGEFLDQLGKAIERVHVENLKKINDDYNETRKKTFRENETDLYNRRLAALAKQKEKYRNRLQEKATIYTQQPSIHLENTPDLFEGNGGNPVKIPVYKYDPAKTPLTKTDTPQWITISWGGGEMQDEVFKHLHRSMLQNVDYNYIYNYFFDKGKVQGKKYLPLQAPDFVEKTLATEESEKSKKIRAENGTLFFDDFSNTPKGNTPVNWKSDNNFAGEPATTDQPKESTGNWAVLKGNKITLKNKLDLPADFTLSCDIAVPKGYTWGAKRLTLKIGTDKASFLVSMRPGFDGNPGFLYAGPDQYGSTILAAGSMAKDTEAPAHGFSNNNPFNRIQLTVRKKGKSLELLINQKQAMVIPEAFTGTGIKLQGLEFSHSRSDSATEKYYITNIQLNSQ